ncbi:pH-sensitive chloride channel 2 [Macrosteles quadrilineatus]|uniref:pH-sensitive chloride channel 2 n=1 Tax=Macrosteles quadrilineatus TaxID=74068 RepID=UPI0023E1C1A8|nr:pH-sensitive chloride channel 2 [Macrosteles quadrilineatus]
MFLSSTTAGCLLWITTLGGHWVKSEFCPSPLNLTGSHTEHLMQLTEPCRYDRWTRPQYGNGGKTHVHTRIYVYFLGSIEAQNLQFTTHILIRYRWRDPRLERNSSLITGDNMLMDRIWTPHLYLVNEHESKIMGSGRQDVLISIQPDGTILHSTRMKVTLLCLMNLQKFPFDNQVCPLVLESWTYNTSQLELHWETDSPVMVNKDLQLTEYALLRVSPNKSEAQYSIDETDTSQGVLNYYGKFAGNYSTLVVNFALKREVGHYLMDYYVPSILLVVVSWVTFWLDANAVPGRTTLGTSTMLTFITLSRNIGSSLPKVSYIKATEIWFIVCTGFIFGSLVEFAFVNIIWRRRKNVELKKVNSKYILKSTLTPQLNRKNNTSSLGPKCKSLSSLSDPGLDSDTNNSQLTVMSLDSIGRDPLKEISATSLTVPVVNFEDPTPPPQSPNKSFFTMTPQEIANWIDRRSRIVFPLAFIIFNCFYWVFVSF